MWILILVMLNGDIEPIEMSNKVQCEAAAVQVKNAGVGGLSAFCIEKKSGN